MMLYRYIFMNAAWSLNYVVYRHFEDLKCSEEIIAEAHRVATFVCESEAENYCAYRNQMMAKYGTDAVEAIDGLGVFPPSVEDNNPAMNEQALLELYQYRIFRRLQKLSPVSRMTFMTDVFGKCGVEVYKRILSIYPSLGSMSVAP